MKLVALTALATLMALPALACETDLMKDKNGKLMASSSMTHEGHAMPAMGADINASTQELDAAMNAMHKAMMVPYTGNADIDFLRGMVPHHQGAVEMAKIQLKYGKDVQIKRLARDIIRAQEIEIRWMNGWLKQLEAKQPSAPMPADHHAH